MSQKLKILSHLKRGPLTPYVALDRYGCMRLAARIEELRNDGHRIETEYAAVNGKRFARYHLR